MKRIKIAFYYGLLMLIVLSSSTLWGQSINLRIAYSLGATTPLSLPASIRGINHFRLTPNFMVGGDYHYSIDSTWGLSAGLRFENKGMNAEAHVKQYQMTMVRGNQVLAGQFSGDVTTQVVRCMISIPLQAVFHPSKHIQLRLGPTFSWVVSQQFSGVARNGYLREGTPIGPKILIGDDDACQYNFSEEMQHFILGVDMGFDWRCYAHLGVMAELSIGLNNTFKKEFKTIEQKMVPVYGTLGVIYYLGNL